MLVLFETAAGFAVFKLLDEKKIKDVDNLAQHFETVESASQIVQLAEFYKFQDSAEALAAAVAINEGTVSKPLKSVLKKVMKKELHKKLLVLDAKLGASIKSKLPELKIVSNSTVSELIRCIRGQMESLIPGISEKEASAMMLGLGHNLARYKLKFSPDKVDTMVIQAVNLLDDLDKELNNYVMRAKEWYGWHFPELAKILTDNTSYIHTIKRMGFRVNASTTNFDDILSDELSERVKEAAEVSMGCEISEGDIQYMQELCDQILDLTAYRTHLHEYLINRMVCLAPNLSIMVGELIGARLIAHTGSLINLAKNPASTLQLIGAEKALFRALKTKKSTPKYGIIYHAELVAKAPTASKGKMSRMLAAKAALAARVDALGEDTNITLGENSRCALLKRITYWNSGKSHRISGQSKRFTPKQHFEENRAGDGLYQASQDSTFGGKRSRLEEEADASVVPKTKKMKTEHTKPLITEMPEPAGAEEKKKKKKKKNKDVACKSEDEEVKPCQETTTEETTEESKKKKKKSKDTAMKSEPVVEVEVKQESYNGEKEGEKKKKKKKKNKLGTEVA